MRTEHIGAKFVKKNNGGASRDSKRTKLPRNDGDKTCFTCGRQGHFSEGCWFKGAHPDASATDTKFSETESGRVALARKHRRCRKK